MHGEAAWRGAVAGMGFGRLAHLITRRAAFFRGFPSRASTGIVGRGQRRRHHQRDSSFIFAPAVQETCGFAWRRSKQTDQKAAFRRSGAGESSDRARLGAVRFPPARPPMACRVPTCPVAFVRRPLHLASGGASVGRCCWRLYAGGTRHGNPPMPQAPGGRRFLRATIDPEGDLRRGFSGVPKRGRIFPRRFDNSWVDSESGIVDAIADTCPGGAGHLLPAAAGYKHGGLVFRRYATSLSTGSRLLESPDRQCHESHHGRRLQSEVRRMDGCAIHVEVCQGGPLPTGRGAKKSARPLCLAADCAYPWDIRLQRLAPGSGEWP